MDENNKLLDKLYLNPVIEGNTHRRVLHPIRQKELNKKTLSSSRSVGDLFSGLNGNVIMQNWNTKSNIPKDIGECINLPVIVDRKKISKLKNLSSLNINNNRNLLNEKKFNFDVKKVKLKSIQDLKNENLNSVSNNLKNVEQKIMNLSNKKFSFNYYPKESENSFQKMKRSESQSLIYNQNDNVKLDNLILNDNNEQSTKESISKGNSISLKKKKKKIPIDFTNFRQHLFLQDNDFLYAKRIGGPVDFLLCSYQEINKLSNFQVSSKIKSYLKNKISPQKNFEYLTISKNTILHYQKGVPHLYSVNEWINNYTKYKKLMEISLFKNFKTAKLFELWSRFYKKTKRAYYTEKLKKRFHLIDIHLLRGILDIRKILKEMVYYNLFKIEIPSPVFLNKFSQLYVDGLQNNNRKIDDFRNRVKRELNNACKFSYLNFKKIKNITLDDNATSDENIENVNDNNENKASENSNNEKNNEQNENNNNTEKKVLSKKAKEKKTQENNLQAFLKDAIPYAQDATRKRHYKKLLRYIRLIDFLFNQAKFDLIIFSLKMLNKKFERLYEAYLNEWSDNPIIVAVILTLGSKISYNPSMELIKTAIFDHFIQENIYTTIYKKSFIDPQEFPQYMICFEEVFEISIDQNSVLNGRVKESDEFNFYYKSIKKNFDNCHKALNKYANDLTPILNNYISNSKINFVELEEEATHEELRDLIVKLKEEDQKVRALKKKINIGLFEFQLDYLLDQVVYEPRKLLKKCFLMIPNILVRKTKLLNEKVEIYYKKIMNNPTNVETFISLKKECEECTKIRNTIDEEEDEINELINIAHNYKEIRLQEYDKKSISELKILKNRFERRYDSVVYFIDNNIAKFRNDLMVKIKKFDDKIKHLITELNEDIINIYHEDTAGPILFLEDKSLQIERAVENKKIFQQQEIDIEMEEIYKSNFENLDELTYQYDLKMKIWKNISEFQKLKKKLDNTQILSMDTKSCENLIDKWIKICKVSLIDLDNSNVPKEFLERVLIYQKVNEIVKIIQNENIQKIDYLKDTLKFILGINFDFNENFFTVGKLLKMENIFNLLDELRKLNLRANEEKRIKIIYKNTYDEYIIHHIPLKLKVDNEKGSQKFIILFSDFDKEYEYIEKNLMILNQELLNEYASVIEKDLKKLISNYYKYENFLNSFYDYQLYMLKSEALIFNTEFQKEMPTEYKKLISESMTKNLTKILKDSLILSKYIENSHERVMNYLSNLINNYELNYKSINIYLERKKKDFQEFYLLSDEDLLNLFQYKENFEIRQKLLLKFFPFMKEIKPGNDNEEFMKIKTFFYNEELNIKYTKTTRTLKDDIETFQQGITKRLKEQFKLFKREFDGSQKPKSKKRPFEVIIDTIKNKDNIAQAISQCVYYSIYDSLEKSLVNEEEAFDKLFDLYHENKNGKKEEYIKLLKNDSTNDLQRKILISLISLENYFITMIENLIREDVVNPNDYTFQVIVSIKLENDFINIKLFNCSFEYGNEYVGLQNNFYFLPQTEKIFISIFNVLSLKKPFLIFNNQNYLKKETLSIISNILGKYINFFECNEKLEITGINNLFYGYMRNGNWICLENVNVVENNILNLISDRIMEVYRNIKASIEEGIYIENQNERYSINEKHFNIFLSYNVDFIGRKNIDSIPINIKDYFRIIGMNNIKIEIYLKLVLKNYAIDNPDEIGSKIIFIIKNLTSKSECFNQKGLREKIEFNLIKKMKFYLMDNIQLINKKTINKILKSCMFNILNPFIKYDENEKNNIEKLINIIFCDYEEEEEKLRIEKENTLKNKNRKEPTNEKKEKINQIIKLNLFDSTIEKEINKFHFQNEEYFNKIKDLYLNFENFNSFVIVGPVLTGKTNILVTLRDISLQLNNINNEKYPIFDYIKIFQNSMTYEKFFFENNVIKSHQNSNYFFKNILDLLIDGSDYDLNDIDEHYKKTNLVSYTKLIEHNKSESKRKKSTVRYDEKTSSENEEEEKKNEEEEKEEKNN